MNESRFVNVRTRGVRGNFNEFYDLYSSNIIRIKRDCIKPIYRERITRNVSCQCNLRTDFICTCRKLAPPEHRYFSFPKQVYRYSDRHNITDIGVGSIKALPRKRIRKIYLPETTDKAIGSGDLPSHNYKTGRRRWNSSYYENKRTSSKCVGGFLGDDGASLVNKKLSPIVQKKSGVTSPNYSYPKDQIRNSANYSINYANTISTQVDISYFNPKPQLKEQSSNNKSKTSRNKDTELRANITVTKDILPQQEDKIKSTNVDNNTDTCKDYSSDSFVQHVHNLENPSEEKNSKMSVDPMENKLEREYRKMFTSKSKERPSITDKPIPDLKSASLLRRRFEALRRGLGKKESKKESIIVPKPASRISVASRKDVSIASDPPSLEGRSFSSTKICSPFPTNLQAEPKVSHRKSPKKNKENPQWPSDIADSKYEGVQGMFKLWSKKFELDEGYTKTSPSISNETSRKEENPVEFSNKKKEKRKFFFFPKRNKDKENKPFKPKKGVTAGRCEVKDGLRIKVGGVDTKPIKVPLPVKKSEKLEGYEGLLRKTWLEKFITNVGDSRNSVHIRWNNKTYATSSSTILELMDSVYKQTGLNFRSRSEVTTGESSNYRSFTKQRVHFVHQDIETWMIPNMITNKPKVIVEQERFSNYTKKNPNKISNQRWFVDATKGFAQTIDSIHAIVLHAKPNSKSSEYIIINIPDDYIIPLNDQSSSNDIRNQSSDEKINRIVEYETSELKKVKENHQVSIEDIITKKIKVTVSVQNDEKRVVENKISEKIIKKVSHLRDVAIQGSNVFLPKRCDVVGVGIITQRDIRDGTKPILKLEDDLSDEEYQEKLSNQKKCEFAESYLQEYCRNWMPSGIDLFSWHVSGSQTSLENNSNASLSQGNCTKSCSNIYDDFQEPTLVLSSCETSSCSHCIGLEEEKKQEDSFKCKFLNKFKKKSFSEAPLKSDMRHFPKDSLEVYKKRMFYACNNQKCKWINASREGSSTELNKSLTRPCWKSPEAGKKKKGNQKRVSLPGCGEMSKIAIKLSDRSPEGILSYKGSGCKQKGSQSPKHTEVLPKPVCEIPQPPCKESCETEKKPPCTKKNAPPCDDLFQDLLNPQTLPPCERPQNTPPPCSNSIPVCIKPKKMKCSSPCRDVKRTSDKNLQLSNKPSQESGLSLKMSPRASPKPSYDNVCKRPKDCIPKCANKKKLSNPMAPPPAPPPTICSDSNKNKMSGLHLKKLPSRKRCTADCDSDGAGVIRLNSHERITIRMKKETPSTEEIREGLNIKVLDEDGRTLYERIDYKQSGDVNKCPLVQDVYKDHQIRRASTPTIVQDAIARNSGTVVEEGKSHTSIDNLIEINLTLKLKQGDKGTKVDIENDGGEDMKQTKAPHANESHKDIYIVQDRAEQALVAENKKDVNIKIVIKNYNVDPDKSNQVGTYTKQKLSDANFCKRISEKFQTVSTGYSDVIDHQAFSIHNATIDLTTSTTCVCKGKSTCDCESNELSIENEPEQVITSSRSVTERTITEQIVNSMKYDNEDKSSTASFKHSLNNNYENSIEISNEETDEFDGNNSDKYTNKENIDLPYETSNESFLYNKFTLRNKTQKKELLKKLFRSTGIIKKPENKKKIKELLHAVLTSDSSVNEVTSNELAKELTYASLDPCCFRDTDSMNNYYQFDSEFSIYKDNVLGKLNSTKANSESSENVSNVSFKYNKMRGCLCNVLANKLDLPPDGKSNGGCCCRKVTQNDKDVTCDFGADYYHLKARIDVETQNSKASSKVRSKTQSVVITNTSFIVKKSIENELYKNKCINTILSYLKAHTRNRINRETIFGLKEDEILVLNSNVVDDSISRSYTKKITKHKENRLTAADILQLNETKKAVLEIYAEKIISGEGERLVAKLPKFDLKIDSDFDKYGNSVRDHNEDSQHNFVTSVNR